MVVIVVLSTICLFSNTLLIMTIYRNPCFRHSQHVYRVSIAVADVLLPLFVAPYMAHTTITQSNYQLKYDERNIYINNQSNFSSNLNSFYAPSSDYLNLFSDSYLNFFGFFSTIVLFCSNFTLLLASCDRLYAVSFPLKYRKNNSVKNTIKICLCVWTIIVLFALLPIVTEQLYYKVRSRALITMKGKNSTTIKSVLLGLPIPLIWSVSILTFIIVRKKTRKAVRMRNNENSSEIKLAATLLLMVLTFTISVLPFTIMYLLQFSKKPYKKITDVDFDELEAFLNFEWVAFMLFLFNSIWNFFIYNIRDDKFRKEFYTSYFIIIRFLRCRYFFNKATEMISSERSNEANHTTNF